MVEIASHFSTLEDPRINRTRRHEFMDIIITAVCAVICGADTWTDIAEYGRSKIDWLKTFLALPNGIPCDDTYRRVLSRLDPDAFGACFTGWIQSLADASQGRLVAIDGKTMRGSFDTAAGKAAIHMVSAWAAENRLTLAQLATEEKSNEITAIPRLLQLIDVKGAIVTIDAMGTQKKIAAAIVDGGADYVLTLKENQPLFYEETERFFQWAQSERFKEVPYTYTEDTDGGHGRIEVRRLWATSDLSWFAERHKWAGLKTLVMVERERTIGEKTTFERHYYISTLDYRNPKRIAHAIRGHWGIENSVHWVLDVAFQEDRSRIRKDHGPENFSLLRKIAHCMLQQEKTAKVGIAIKRRKAGWDNNYLLTLLMAGSVKI